MRPVEAAFTVLKQFTSPEEIERQRQAMEMFQQVQAAKLARQQQMIGAGLNPMTGAPQPVQTTPPQNIPQGQPQFQQTCPTCGGTGIMQGQ